MAIRIGRLITGVALLLVVEVLAVSPRAVGADTAKPAGSTTSDVPKGKQTTLGLYVTAAKAYEMWKAAPEKVKTVIRQPFA